MKSDYHLPVLLKESINGLKIDDEGIYVDATFGGGGHSLEILRSLSKKGRLVIWPASWTHFHRSEPNKGLKYIISGWYSFY